MCIVCNLPPEQISLAWSYMDAVRRAREEMRKAERLLLVVADKATTPEQARQYRKTHKALIKRRKAWNAAESARENLAEPFDDGSGAVADAFSAHQREVWRRDGRVP